jgi:hypothetical protein
MAKKNYHVVPKGDSWAIKGVGNGRYSRVVNTQKDAILIAKGYAQNHGSELVIHRPNGQIRTSWSYGSDPFPPKG